MDRFIRIYTQRTRTPKQPGVVVRDGGGALSSYQVSRDLPDGFREHESWRDGGFRAVWSSYRDQAIVTYCEGDIIVESFTTAADYYAALEACTTFYLTH